MSFPFQSFIMKAGNTVWKEDHMRFSGFADLLETQADRHGRAHAFIYQSEIKQIVSYEEFRSDVLARSEELKKTEKTRKRDSPTREPRLPASFKNGRNTFSCLKPSRMESIKKSVPSVRQSISARRRADGGVIKRATIAANRDTVSMGSFFSTGRHF